MCKAENIVVRKQPLVMIHEKAYETNGAQPSRASCLVTGSLIIAFLIAMEQTLRKVLFEYKDAHPILEDETNRMILARHVGVDTLSCLIVAYLGWTCRHLLNDMVRATFGDSRAMPIAGYDARLFSSHPGALRILLFFFSYQVKNLYDTIVWNDGPEFIFHHVASLAASYSAIFPGFAHSYAVFFVGLSEISTAVLCLLANFDDEHGVKGMGDAFPLTKVTIGGIFFVLFILCRSIAWPIATYYIMRDSYHALKHKSARAQQRRYVVISSMVLLGGLSILQLAWLGVIFITAKKEFAALGLI